MMFTLEVILLVALPFGTAILFGAISERAGPVISGGLSVAGMFFGIYLVHKVFEWTIVAHLGSSYGS
jgi:hypothetical protein